MDTCEMRKTLTQFCYCGLPLYYEFGKISCKKHGENFKDKPIKVTQKRYSGKSKSEHAFGNY